MKKCSVTVGLVRIYSYFTLQKITHKRSTNSLLWKTLLLQWLEDWILSFAESEWNYYVSNEFSCIISVFFFSSWKRLRMTTTVDGSVSVKAIARTFASGKTEKLVYQTLSECDLPSGKVRQPVRQQGNSSHWCKWHYSIDALEFKLQLNTIRPSYTYISTMKHSKSDVNLRVRADHISSLCYMMICCCRSFLLLFAFKLRILMACSKVESAA